MNGWLVADGGASVADVTVDGSAVAITRRQSDLGAAPEEAAKAICVTCGVTERCTAWASAVGIREGVFGGLTADGRRKVRHLFAAAGVS
jgi:hypothetical protein